MGSASGEPELTEVGRVAKAHGIRGEIKFLGHGGPDIIDACGAVYLRARDGRAAAHEVVRRRYHGKYAILSLEGVTTRDQAEALVGMTVLVDRRDLPPLAEGEYYWHDMLGLAVYTEGGRELGRVARLMETGAHDLLVVRGAGTEYLIPVIDEIIVEIDEAGKRLVIAPMPGLLEINEPG